LRAASAQSKEPAAVFTGREELTPDNSFVVGEHLSYAKSSAVNVASPAASTGGATSSSGYPKSFHA
jgi:hypothetical protein